MPRRSRVRTRSWRGIHRSAASKAEPWTPLQTPHPPDPLVDALRLSTLRPRVTPRRYRGNSRCARRVRLRRTGARELESIRPVATIACAWCATRAPYGSRTGARFWWMRCAYPPYNRERRLVSNVAPHTCERRADKRSASAGPEPVSDASPLSSPQGGIAPEIPDFKKHTGRLRGPCGVLP